MRLLLSTTTIELEKLESLRWVFIKKEMFRIKAQVYLLAEKTPLNVIKIFQIITWEY